MVATPRKERKKKMKVISTLISLVLTPIAAFLTVAVGVRTILAYTPVSKGAVLGTVSINSTIALSVIVIYLILKEIWGWNPFQIKDNIGRVVIAISASILISITINIQTTKYLPKSKPTPTRSSGSTDTSSNEYNCDWQSELMSRGAAYRCANSSGCPHGCYNGRWRKYGYSSPKECAKASVACLNKRCGHLCK